MGVCSRRHFLLTICTLQLVTTVERQVFDFLGFMWAPILVNFFNIIFVILGFFGAFQYRPKYIIAYCVWNTLWLGWNVFIICFYLNVGILDKNSDLLNLGTGSFSWWHVNGPGCKVVYDVTEPELFRPARPSSVTDCILDYEVVEVLHASVQCILGFMAIIGGICLSKVFLEEDDSFDFVGGESFGLAGHTALHPMYVSYSALPGHSNKHLDITTATTSTTTTTTTTLHYPTGTSSSRQSQPSMRSSEQARVDSRAHRGHRVEYAADYASPLDQLQRPISPYDEYDYLDAATARYRYQRHRTPYEAKYSPVGKSRAVKPRIFTDHVREQPLRSFYSDPRLTNEAQQPNVVAEDTRKRDSRPLSLYASNY